MKIDTDEIKRQLDETEAKLKELNTMIKNLQEQRVTEQILSRKLSALLYAIEEFTLVGADSVEPEEEHEDNDQPPF